MSDAVLAWLRAQLDDDERMLGDSGGGMCDGGVHLDDERWRAEIEAKRQIIGMYEDYAAERRHLAPVIYAIAQPYADRPGFPEEWR